MYRTVSCHRWSLAPRIVRAGFVQMWARWLVVLLIAPALLLGMCSRGLVLFHCHDDHGVHRHSVSFTADGKLVAADHSGHGHGCATLPSDAPGDGQPQDEGFADVPGGVVVCSEVHKQLPTRGVDLAKTLSPAAALAIVAFVVPPSPDPDVHIGSPGGTGLSSCPMNLLALRAADRLVRTSCALLL